MYELDVSVVAESFDLNFCFYPSSALVPPLISIDLQHRTQRQVITVRVNFFIKFFWARSVRNRWQPASLIFLHFFGTIICCFFFLVETLSQLHIQAPRDKEPRPDLLFRRSSMASRVLASVFHRLLLRSTSWMMPAL